MVCLGGRARVERLSPHKGSRCASWTLALAFLLGGCSGVGEPECPEPETPEPETPEPQNEPPGAPDVWIPSPSGPGAPVPPELPIPCLLIEPGADEDGDVVYHRYSWTVDGEDFDFSGSELSADHTEGGQVWTCSVTPFDGKHEGKAGVATVLVDSNQAPSQPVVEITPSMPQVGEDLDCTVLIPSEDPDGDHVTYFFSWERDEEELDYEGSEIFASETSSGQTWTCLATATDGLLESKPGVASVTIQ